MSNAVVETNIPGFPLKRGKVRDVYDLGEALIIVATDRISAFDYILPTPIPGKGKILTAMTNFWLDRLEEDYTHHRISCNLADMPPAFRERADILEGRTMLVRKTKVIPFECVVRGYLAGSGWKDYLATGAVCGHELPERMQESEQLPEPLFTPATKPESGHDINVSLEQMAETIDPELVEVLQAVSLSIYDDCAEYARERGIIIADTKLEWGLSDDGELVLIDEVLTPDSSRFWPADAYQVGMSPPSFDKQFVRDWLANSGWDKNSPPPPLPDEIVQKSAAKYQEALERLTRG
ncbi:phosphoribosylaminoimidazolesuccinocarboxamide synthase [Tuwongella immobilis]|uniref:Phosphoribosylaminoimidazole-succinocarboxamide synthase n=1 Tax=Tuwongella immobilis TaxID=692036 RepID=A0A6C2YT56_9BACT|nr:phosphoribosylaminoimidazolesuccinocarboxamide synthase [Tuwongella immobilis]VIP04219.1 phosphoribosylaminoimidazole-succinocarboxamide synthase : Phosphoribosylaminoimidazole-succinocarboxamide synthase OS=Planctomyces maris DSM 8797 GN=purC PE=3 SV=1: SAICAR_synt [Tuwongella immobilis]VTS05802.1 phosphoribosylaminoimidazole-succinocarboxamide synthase : Phosphoribosylaminoimidazole-succinocarboxamide synthase OS=Planctomyces maris DSM 8797 GN=purC PE=3 SV=1: SAICAR_synt [Tuwongella immobili